MSNFIGDCDYCGEFVEVQWIFDRHHNEDRVACPDCRTSRHLERAKVPKVQSVKVPAPKRGEWAEQ